MSATHPLIEREESLVVDGMLIGRYHLYSARRPCAELFEPTVDIEKAAAVIIEQLTGWNITTSDDGLIQQLLNRGAQSVRRFSLMFLDLTSWSGAASDSARPRREVIDYKPAPITPDTVVSSALVDLIRRAYPPGHPDEELGSDAEIVADVSGALHGSRMGPLMSESRLAVESGRPVGMALLNRVVGQAPTGGPWLTDICRDPDERYTGLGRALLHDVLRDCQAQGEPTLSLAVTHGNSARRLYESVGFVTAADTHKLRLPG
ncbi:MAG TPA: GNAT family N-acetyltransferase [Actinomycetes bacterium]|nr:GNAT family N-acetyltransferase [Actinomycetes bacterium]